MLKSIDLKLNDDKTTKESVRNYRNNNKKDDPRYNQLGKRTHWLMKSLYYFPKQYNDIKKQNESLFLKEYEELLNRICIFFSDFPHWLGRKIFQYSSIINKVKYNINRLTRMGIKVSFPKFRLGMNEQEKDEWKQEFERLNPLWLKEHQSVRSELTVFFRESYERFKQSQSENKKNHRRAMRFSIYRLSCFGVASIVTELEEILRSNPWDISHRIVLKALVDSSFSHIVLSLAKDWHYCHLPVGMNDNGDMIKGMKCSYALNASACRALSYAKATSPTTKINQNQLLISFFGATDKLDDF